MTEILLMSALSNYRNKLKMSCIKISLNVLSAMIFYRNSHGTQVDLEDLKEFEDPDYRYELQLMLGLIAYIGNFYL